MPFVGFIYTFSMPCSVKCVYPHTHTHAHTITTKEKRKLLCKNVYIGSYLLLMRQNKIENKKSQKKWAREFNLIYVFIYQEGSRV